jgi:hypothetical protein
LIRTRSWVCNEQNPVDLARGSLVKRLDSQNDSAEFAGRRLSYSPRNPFVVFSIRLLSCVAVSLAFLPSRAADVIPPAGAPVFNHARFFPAPLRGKEMVGGRFSGSNVSATEGFVVLAEIKTEPREQEWTDLVFSNNRLYRWLRYEAPSGSYGNVAELEFYSGTRKMDGLRFATIGERNGRGWRFAFDGDPKTWVDADEPDGQRAGIDLRDQATARTPKFSPPPAGIQKPLSLLLTGLTPYATIRYTLDGSMPGPKSGLLYTKPFLIEQSTTVVAASFVEGWAASPPVMGTYLIGEVPLGLRTLHIGNSLTDITGQFSEYARTAHHPHVARTFTLPGATTHRLWDVGLTQRKSDWQIALEILDHVDHVTVQPRDFKTEEEADYARRFFDLVRQKSPDVQPWLYTEWVERERIRPSDRAEVPSSQMKKLWPALTWEESMGAMLLYVEGVQRKLVEIDKGAKPARVLPTNLAMGWIKKQIDRGEFPGAAPGSFYPLLFRDSVHPNLNGSYLVDLTWYAAFYGESPVGKVLPIGTDLTPEQATAMQLLAWEVIRNYPGCGLYEEGKTPVGKPQFSPAPTAIKDVLPVTLSSSTPGTWFRYTLDGTVPTRTNGYVYCGVISVRPGMTVKAVAFQSGFADSAVAEAVYALAVDAPATSKPPAR